MNNRDKSIDVIKGFLIICVVIGHVIANYNPVGCFTNPIFMLCYSFHMYLFFFVSGYLTGNKNSLDALWLKRKVTRLLVPYIVWSLIKFFTSSTLEKGVLSFLNVLVISPIRWFLLVLFIVEVLMYLILRTSKKTVWRVLVFIMIYVICYVLGYYMGNVGHNLKLIAIYMPFYFFGYIIRNKQIVLSRVKCVVLCILYPLAMFFYSIENHERILNMAWNCLELLKMDSNTHVLIYKVIEKVGIPFYNHIIVAMLGCVFWWNVIRFLCGKFGEKNTIFNIIAFVGIYSLQIYMMSDYFFVFSNFGKVINELLSILFGVVGPCIVAYFIKKKIPKLSKVLFGT